MARSERVVWVGLVILAMGAGLMLGISFHGSAIQPFTGLIACLGVAGLALTLWKWGKDNTSAPVVIQDEPIAREDLTPYRGRWVALRDGYVKADADVLEDLIAYGGVLSTDVMLHVPEHDVPLFL
jgi:hypothetical protein